MAENNLSTLRPHGAVVDLHTFRTARVALSGPVSNPGSQLQVIEGAPHGLIWTHAAAVNERLQAFLKETARVTA